jgi:hypothetical protein
MQISRAAAAAATHPFDFVFKQKSFIVISVFKYFSPLSLCCVIKVWVQNV